MKLTPEQLMGALQEIAIDQNGVPFARAMDYQLSDLVRWKRKLNQECYAALHRYAVKHRVPAAQPLIHHRHDVARGCELTEFVCNWQPRPCYGRVAVKDMELPEVES